MLTVLKGIVPYHASNMASFLSGSQVYFKALSGTSNGFLGAGVRLIGFSGSKGLKGSRGSKDEPDLEYSRTLVMTFPLHRLTM